MLKRFVVYPLSNQTKFLGTNLFIPRSYIFSVRMMKPFMMLRGPGLVIFGPAFPPALWIQFSEKELFGASNVLVHHLSNFLKNKSIIIHRFENNYLSSIPIAFYNYLEKSLMYTHCFYFIFLKPRFCMTFGSFFWSSSCPSSCIPTDT